MSLYEGILPRWHVFYFLSVCTWDCYSSNVSLWQTWIASWIPTHYKPCCVRDEYRCDTLITYSPICVLLDINYKSLFFLCCYFTVHNKQPSLDLWSAHLNQVWTCGLHISTKSGCVVARSNTGNGWTLSITCMEMCIIKSAHSVSSSS